MKYRNQPELGRLVNKGEITGTRDWYQLVQTDKYGAINTTDATIMGCYVIIFLS